jgi:hypothetical protein
MQHYFGSFVLLAFVIAALVDVAETVRMIHFLFILIGLQGQYPCAT